MALRADESGMELPINIVVMVVVGLAALSALLLMLPKPALQTFVTVTGVDAEFDGTPGTYERQAALILKLPSSARESWVKVKIQLADKEGKPVRDATCLLRGFGTVLVSKAGAAAGEYEFDGMSPGASKMSIAGATEGSLSVVCDQVPSGYLKPETRTVTVVVA
ncbi:MAG: hypothetical protein QXO51_01710 [Halobacteria archaeon]